MKLVISIILLVSLPLRALEMILVSTSADRAELEYTQYVNEHYKWDEEDHNRFTDFIVDKQTVPECCILTQYRDCIREDVYRYTLAGIVFEITQCMLDPRTGFFEVRIHSDKYQVRTYGCIDPYSPYYHPIKDYFHPTAFVQCDIHSVKDSQYSMLNCFTNWFTDDGHTLYYYGCFWIPKRILTIGIHSI